jgi:bifunctional ADP-heptose synthase (sugar kinase/adenylyltransferase)
LIIDETYYVNVEKLSPEAPVPSAQLTRLTPIRTPGGAGFAAAYASTYDSLNVSLISAVEPSNLSLLWFNHNINAREIITDNIKIKNVVKTRYIDNESNYHLIRIDNDNIVGRPNIRPEQVIENIEEEVNACILSDYAKGFFSSNYCWAPLVKYLKDKNIPTILDTRSKNLLKWLSSEYDVLDCWLKLNNREFNNIISMIGAEDFNKKVGKLALTQGSQGATIIKFNQDGENIVYGYESETQIDAIDVTGCGDVFDVSFILEKAQGSEDEETLRKAVDTASHWARIPFKDKLKCLSQPRKD